MPDTSHEKAEITVFSHHQRNFFGRRNGKKLTTEKRLSLSEDLPSYLFDMTVSFEDEAALCHHFNSDIIETWLEIGFGGGEHLIWQTLHHQNIAMIGAEPFVNGVASAVKAATQAELRNRLRLYTNDVVPLIDRLPNESIGRAFMLFPDPWPKNKHRYRRLLTASFLEKLGRILKINAEFRFASDIADYVDDVLSVVSESKQFELVLVHGSHQRDRLLDWPITRYEMKAQMQGRQSRFLILKRNSN